MPNRFSKSAAEFGAAHGATTITPASVAQASSLHHLIPKISISKRTGGVSPPKLNRRLCPPKSERRLLPPHSMRGTLEVSGANLMYEGSRVKSWMLGRDVNPAGRGDGSYYAQGGFSIGSIFLRSAVYGIAKYLILFTYAFIFAMSAGFCEEKELEPGSFKHMTVKERYEQIRWPYETGWYIIKGAINTRAQIGGPILLTGSWPDQGGGYSIAYFVPFDEYNKRIELGYSDEKLVDGCTSTYTFRLFRYIDFFKSPQGSNFSVDYLEYLRDAGIVELLFVPDIKPGMYCLVFKMILQDPYYTLENEPFYEYLNLHYILSDERMEKIDYVSRFTVQIDGSITNDIQKMYSEGSVSDGEELLKVDVNNGIESVDTRFTDGGCIQKYLYVFALAFIVAFLCGYYCRNIRIRVAKRR